MDFNRYFTNQELENTTHDLATAGFFTDRMAVMYLGRVLELVPTKEALSDPRHWLR